MNGNFNKNEKVEQVNKMFLSRGEEKGLIVKDPLPFTPIISRGFFFLSLSEVEVVAQSSCMQILVTS